MRSLSSCVEQANNKSNKVLITAAGAVVPLVELLRGDSPLCKEHGALALTNIAAAGQNKVSIAKAGAVAPLIELLRSGTIRCKQRAALALSHLASNNAANKLSIIAAGAVELLVELQRGGTAGCKEYAAVALATLAPTTPSLAPTTRFAWRWPLSIRSSVSWGDAPSSVRSDPRGR